MHNVSLVVLLLACASLDWEYPGHPLLGLFRIYVSSTSSAYQFGQAFVPGGYVAIVPGIPEMLTSLDCGQLFLVTTGHAYSVVTAVSKDLRLESGPSNEIILPAAQTPLMPPSVPPSLPPSAPPPVVTLPPPPPPMGPTTFPTLPPPASSGDYISQTPQWNGTPYK